MALQTVNTSIEEFKQKKEQLKQFRTQYDPVTVEKEAIRGLDSFTPGNIQPENPLFKTLTLKEFDNGMLMTTAIPEQYKTFAIDMSRKLQEEYNCQKISEKATCELAALSYARMIESQRRLNLVLSQGTANETINQFIATISKELDRATRHYFTSIQTLRLMKQTPLNITIKAQTAIIGQHHLVQANNRYE